MLDIFEPAKYVGGLWPGVFGGWKVSEQGGATSRAEGGSAPRPDLEPALTFDPWTLLLFLGSEKVDVRELLGSVGSFRCWPNREVEPSCITITWKENQDHQSVN